MSQPPPDWESSARAAIDGARAAVAANPDVIAQNDRANELLRRLVIREFRDGNRHTHLGECLDLEVMSLDARDGGYGCDTGCEYATLEALVSCPHEEPVAFTYGSFTTLWELIIDLIAEEQRQGGGAC